MTNKQEHLEEQNPQDNLAISKIEWDLSPLLSGDEDPKIELEQKTVAEILSALLRSGSLELITYKIRRF
jgi:hypothetical protein